MDRLRRLAGVLRQALTDATDATAGPPKKSLTIKGLGTTQSARSIKKLTTPRS